MLHIESAPAKSLVQKFYRARIEQAVADIESAHVTSGARIWKLYNHEWFIRTPSVSIAFDIVPSPRTPGFAVDANVLGRVAAQADAMFISHMHGDHANQAVAGMFPQLASFLGRR